MSRVRRVIEAKFEGYGEGRNRGITAMISMLRRVHAKQTPRCDISDCVDFRAVMGSRFGVSNFPSKPLVDRWKDDEIDPLPPIVPTQDFPQVVVIESVTLTKGFPPNFLPSHTNPHLVNEEHEDEEDLLNFGDWIPPLDWSSDPDFLPEMQAKGMVRRIVDAIRALFGNDYGIYPHLQDLHIDVWRDLERGS
jgi:hypothetical protein